MSYKRDGDDAAMLRNLQNRRVVDLLANHIPDDEASLLSNGRLTCTVCSHRPIFDTLAVLSVHRKGNKHIAQLSKYLSHKRELERRKLKEDHQLSLRTGKVKAKPEESPALPTLGSRLVYSPAYSSCVKRSGKQKKFQGLNRKAVLDLDWSIDKEPGSSQSEDSLVSASSEVRRYVKSLWKKKAIQKTIEQRRENRGEAKQTTSEISVAPIRPQPTATPSAGQLEADRQAQHELHLRMSGWLKDRDGRWVKDPTAEFDSDEDEPV